MPFLLEGDAADLKETAPFALLNYPAKKDSKGATLFLVFRVMNAPLLSDLLLISFPLTGSMREIEPSPAFPKITLNTYPCFSPIGALNTLPPFSVSTHVFLLKDLNV